MVSVLLLWELMAGQIDPVLFTKPSLVGVAAVQMIESVELCNLLAPSLLVLVIGLSLVCVVGVAVGLLAGRGPAARPGREPDRRGSAASGDVYLAKKQKPSLHPLVQLADLLPNYMFHAYGASLDWIALDRVLLLDTVAAMIEANRTAYRDREKVVPIIMEAT